MQIDNTETKFDRKELCELYVYILEFIAPRLKAFEQESIGHPMDMTEKEWHKILKKIVFLAEDSLLMENDYFKLQKNHDLIKNYSLEKENKILNKQKEGKKLFFKYFKELWW